MVSSSKFYNPNLAPYLNPKEDRRVVFITGGNSGIGWYTCLHLYLHGYIVYVGGRTESKVLKAIDDIKAEAKIRQGEYSTEEKATRHFGELNHIYIDLTDLSTVPKAVESFGAKEKKLNVLINNAGIMGVPFEETKDGYEIQYQVNYVSHLLLTLKMLPFLQAATNPRIVNLASIGHNFEFKHYSPKDHYLNNFPNALYTWVRYGKSKCSQIQGAKALAKYYPNILSVSVHPGVIVGTELYNHWKNIPGLKFITKGAISGIGKLIGVTNEEGSYATLKVTMDPELSLKENGNYYSTGGILDTPSSVASKESNIEETWKWNIEQLDKRGYHFDI
ncbi:putative oxidoreductase ENV9 [Spathaspora sp. JA1]|nr:putative oxidoreductase ENV9 [Spathaspora sp. JA1]